MHQNHTGIQRLFSSTNWNLFICIRYGFSYLDLIHKWPPFEYSINDITIKSTPTGGLVGINLPLIEWKLTVKFKFIWHLYIISLYHKKNEMQTRWKKVAYEYESASLWIEPYSWITLAVHKTKSPAKQSFLYIKFVEIRTYLLEF